MNLCQWILDNDEECGEICEGRTSFCASHNRQLRRESENTRKAIEKRKAAIQKIKNKVEKVKQALNGTLPKSEYPFMIYKPKRIKKVSEKRKEINVEYFKLVEQFKKDNPHCKAKVNEYCTKTTDDPHHKRGRGKYLLDVSTWLPCCRSCHSFIEAHPKISRDRGWSESRLATVEKHMI